MSVNVKREQLIWERRKKIYERHQAGETYPSIAHDLNISVGRARELAESWKALLDAYEHYKTHPELPDKKDVPAWEINRIKRWHERLDRLANVGLLGCGKRSLQYGYA